MRHVHIALGDLHRVRQRRGRDQHHVPEGLRLEGEVRAGGGGLQEEPLDRSGDLPGHFRAVLLHEVSRLTPPEQNYPAVSGGFVFFIFLLVNFS